MKYRFMEEHRNAFRLNKMCKVLKVSRSGYYVWRKRKPSKRQTANKWLLDRIQEVYKMSRRIYGSPRIKDGLNDQGIICGKNRVARIMKDHSIRAKVCRKFKKTTNSRHSYPASANLLLDGNERGRIWVSDITFILSREGWMYVAAVMDVHSRKIIGLSIKNRLTQDLTTDALKQAISRQRPCKGLIHHSDRGRQYASYEYRDLLKRYGI